MFIEDLLDSRLQLSSQSSEVNIIINSERLSNVPKIIHLINGGDWDSKHTHLITML